MSLHRPAFRPVLRFAPSPTGSLHLGGLRTALFNYLFARKHGGKWILRIEDTDVTRLVPGSVEGIRKALEWAGLNYDYGPGVGGPHAPYFQSKRLELYHEYVKRLLEKGHAYRCFCDRGQLENIRESLRKKGSNATYDRRCLHLSEEEVHRKIRAREKYIVRLDAQRVPKRQTRPDLIFGNLKDAHESLPTDPVLLKTDRYPTYHLASVVDDHEMGITHVLRGEEWLPSLPLHLDLYACLDLRPPAFAHLPLLLNEDGSKMSKRHGDVSVEDYKAKGWLPYAVLNWLALAGWGTQLEYFDCQAETVRTIAPDSTELLPPNELIKRFDLSVFTPRRAVLDPKKLEVLNKKYIQIMTQSDVGIATLVDQAWKVLKETYPGPITTITQLDLVNGLYLAKDRISNVNELPKLLEFLLWDSSNPGAHPAEAQALMKSHGIDSERFTAVVRKYEDLIEETDREGKEWNNHTIAEVESQRTERDEMVILRIALTAKKTGLPLSHIMLLLGRKETLDRLALARESCSLTGLPIDSTK